MARDDTDRKRDGDLSADPFEDTEPMRPDGWASVDALRADVKRLESQLKDRRALLASVDGTAGETKPPPTLADAVDAFVGRLQSDRGQRVYFPWPGGREDMPDRVATIAGGALLPPMTGPSPKPWADLWERVGPLWPDRLAVLVGATGKGKSGFALCLAEATARAGHPVLYLSAEMGTDELVARLLALRAGHHDNHPNGVPYIGILAGKAPDDDVDSAGVALVADCPQLYLWAPRAEQRTAAELERMTRAVVKAADGRPPLVVVDYLQRMADGADLRQAVREVSGKLRDLSRPGGLDPDWPGAAVLALSSTARGNYEHFVSVAAMKEAAEGGWRTRRDGVDVRKPPIPLEGLGKESGELETDAALVLVMTTNPTASRLARGNARAPRAGDDDSPRDALVAIGKNRHGGKGLAPVTFWPASGVFTEAP